MQIIVHRSFRLRDLMSCGSRGAKRGREARAASYYRDGGGIRPHDGHHSLHKSPQERHPCRHAKVPHGVHGGQDEADDARAHERKEAAEEAECEGYQSCEQGRAFAEDDEPPEAGEQECDAVADEGPVEGESPYVARIVQVACPRYQGARVDPPELGSGVVQAGEGRRHVPQWGREDGVWVRGHIGGAAACAEGAVGNVWLVGYDGMRAGEGGDRQEPEEEEEGVFRSPD